MPAGSVSSQNPTAGVGVAAGSAVNLVVSTGPAPAPGTFAVPNVLNLTQAAATTAINGAGLVLGTISQSSSTTVPAGSVISQNPAAGTMRSGRFGGRADRVDWPGSGTERGEYDAGGGDHGDLFCRAGGRHDLNGVECHGAVGQRDQPEPGGGNERGGRFGGRNSGVDRPGAAAPAPPPAHE